MNIFIKNPICEFISENCSYALKRNVMTLEESDISQIGNNLVSKLYKSAINKAHIDFGDIPHTKGDITKYSGYINMVQCLDIMDNISRKSNIKINELDVVQKAIGNIVALREIYVKGYNLNNDFIMLQYSTMTMLCVEATSALIASFVDYVKNVDNTEFRIINTKTTNSLISIENLETFNSSVSSGEYIKACNAVLRNSNSTGIVKESVFVLTAAIIGSLVAACALMRQIVFRFYYTKMKLSDYLKLQAMFLEMNKSNVMAKESKVSPEKRKQVVQKQHELANKLLRLSDKLKVESTVSTTKAKNAMKQEHDTYNIKELSSNDVIDHVELL